MAIKKIRGGDRVRVVTAVDSSYNEPALDVEATVTEAFYARNGRLQSAHVILDGDTSMSFVYAKYLQPLA